MSFADAIRTCLSKYATFSGRGRRSEYWWFALFVFLGSLVLGVLDGILFGADGAQILGPLWQLTTFVPLLAAGWRRMHDTGRSGKLLLLPLAISLATVVLLFFGLVGFGVAEGDGVDPGALAGPAVFLATTGLAIAAVVQFVVTILLVWWLSRPSDPEPNVYGPPPPSLTP